MKPSIEPRRRRALACRALAAGLLGVLAPGWCAAFAASYRFDWSPPAGSSFPGLLTFDLVDGGGADSTLRVDRIDTDGDLSFFDGTGGLAPASPTGATGFTLVDAEFFNEARFQLTGFTRLSIRFSVQGGSGDPAFLPDQFALFVTDTRPGGQWPLFETTDPTGASSLFTLGWRLARPAQLDVYAPVSGGSSWTVTPDVPEPSRWLLLAAGLPLLAARPRPRGAAAAIGRAGHG